MKNATRNTGFVLVGSAALLLALSAPVLARGPAGPGGFGPGGKDGVFTMTFADADLDGDGQITEADLEAHAAARLAEADTDGNGALSADELAAQVLARLEAGARDGRFGRRDVAPEAMAEKMAERMLDRRDADDDGALSLAELAPAQGFGRIIDRFDTDDDNAISQAEFDEVKTRMLERMADRGGRGEGRGHGGKHR